MLSCFFELGKLGAVTKMHLVWSFAIQREEKVERRGGGFVLDSKIPESRHFCTLPPAIARIFIAANQINHVFPPRGAAWGG